MGKAEELAVAVDGLEAGKGKRRRYPTDLRQRLIEFVRKQRAAGAPLKSIAARLGVSPTLLHRWELSRAGEPVAAVVPAESPEDAVARALAATGLP